MTDTPRILFSAKDAPWLPSGYGIITRHLAPRLANHYGKDNVIIYAPVYQRDEVRIWEDMVVLPGGGPDAFGESLIEQHYSKNGCNLLLQVGDWAPLSIIPQLAAENKITWVQWAPFDFLNFPEWLLNAIKFSKRIVPFSQQAEKVFREAGLTQTTPAIWLGLDLSIWQPSDRRLNPKLMSSIGFSEDSYNILIVAANQSRKYLRETLEAIEIFMKAYPQANARVYMHTHARGERQLDIDVHDLKLQDVVRFPDPYLLTLGGIDEQKMAQVFNSADVVLDVCMEGFGLAQTQANAVGIPVISFAEGAGPELVQFGVQVPSYSIDRHDQLLKPVPHPEQIATALEKLYLEYTKGNRRSQQAIDWVNENLSWDKIALQWIAVIDDVMRDAERFSWYIPKPSQLLLERSREIIEVSA